jgi:hypothetical protein
VPLHLGVVIETDLHSILARAVEVPRQRCKRPLQVWRAVLRGYGLLPRDGRPGLLEDSECAVG